MLLDAELLSHLAKRRLGQSGTISKLDFIHLAHQPKTCASFFSAKALREVWAEGPAGSVVSPTPHSALCPQTGPFLRRWFLWRSSRFLCRFFHRRALRSFRRLQSCTFRQFRLHPLHLGFRNVPPERLVEILLRVAL